MKYLYGLLFTLLICFTGVARAQSNNAELAREYSLNNEHQKAADIYQKLFKQDKQAYFQLYVGELIALKKLNEAEAVARTMVRNYPENYEYVISLSNIYTQQGNPGKAEALYNDLIKNLPANRNAVNMLASQFYQTGNADLAIRVFKRGRELLKDDKAFAYELMALYRYRHDKVSLTEECLNFLPANPLFIGQAKNALASVYEGGPDYDMLKGALLKGLQKDPQEVVYTEMLTWVFIQQKEYDMALNQALALSRRQNNGTAQIDDLCRTLVANSAYDAAIRGYEYIIENTDKASGDYIAARINLIDTRNLKITTGRYNPADLLSLESDYNSLLATYGHNKTTAFAMQKLANLQAFKLHKLPEAKALLEEVVGMAGIDPTLLAACKIDLGDVYLLSNQPWDATLLYSQAEKDNPNTAVAQEAMLRNAKLAYYTGDLAWAKRQLDVLKAATTQLIANDALNLSLLISDNLNVDSTGKALKMYARADLLIFAEQPAKALQTLDSIEKQFPGNTLEADVLMAKARIRIQEKDFTGAVLLLKDITEKHSTDLWADDAVFMLGDIYETQLKDTNMAKTYFQKIITDYPGSLWINDARKRFRALRGDKVS
ncbi:tetratricopeptide repeat protein [Mucilaginibacter sp. 44-25]|uniref:tetratricopeptide repeat protein n=1 Tax=Mucilaginibacter sp. 44-25 TaxID=1895794 RepID=UPI000A57670B|nr:tetratricopeptide repeat protein [Mucilaginibacter sp. 44-25]